MCVYMCVYVFMHVYIKISFPKCDKRQAKNRDANAYFGDKLFINMYMYTHIHICEKLFSRALSMNFVLVSQAQFLFLEWHLSRFGKELYICMCMYVCMYVFVHVFLYAWVYVDMHVSNMHVSLYL